MHSKEGAEFGFLGVGSIAEAMVTGLSSVSTAPTLVLAPGLDRVRSP
jgi:pyrroline-5-carboxylate reductase